MRTLSAPSAMVPAPIASAWVRGAFGAAGISSGNRKSPWPPVWEIIAPDGQMRGPAAKPASIARLRPNAGPAMSRTLVNPRISVFPASTAATRLMYPTSAVISTLSGAAAIMACQ